MKRIYFSLFVLVSPFFLPAEIHLQEEMSEEEKQQTGWDLLSEHQKNALDTWINQHCFDGGSSSQEDRELYLSVNLEGGSQLILSDGSTWEVMPQDRATSSVWMTPFPLELSPSNNPKYPWILKNKTSQEVVQVKKISPSP